METITAAVGAAAPHAEPASRTTPMINLPPPALKKVWRQALALTIVTVLAGCANHDFGEVHPVLVTDGIHDWIGRDSGRPKRVPPSRFEYTDDERALRDLAYPLIEPPFDRQQWYSVAGEYGLYRANSADYGRYSERLESMWRRSPSSRYSQLIDDIRNDITRMSQFFETAGRVIDIDQKRQKSMTYISDLGKKEHENALRRVRENAHVVAIVQQSSPTVSLHTILLLSGLLLLRLRRKRSKPSDQSNCWKIRSRDISSRRPPGYASQVWRRRTRSFPGSRRFGLPHAPRRDDGTLCNRH